jgi:hypothetical protein
MIPIIRSSQFIYEFQRNIEIRKRVFEFEDNLEVFFPKPYKVIQIPEQIHPYIPRFESTANNKRSKLEVSQIRIQLSSSYTEDYSKDINKIYDFIKKRIELLNRLALKEKVLYVGYITELSFEMDDKAINPFLKKYSNASAIDENIHDFNMLYSKSVEPYYFVNINFSKYLEQEIEINTISKTGQEAGPSKKGISVVVDINTKYSLKKNNPFSIDYIQEVQDKMKNIIVSNKLENYVSGKVEYEKK